jgi:hypothetical protein
VSEANIHQKSLISTTGELRPFVLGFKDLIQNSNMPTRQTANSQLRCIPRERSEHSSEISDFYHKGV